jgi:glycosyltransferase involved in cell wall biosynthesis
MPAPQVSVCIPVRNHARYVGEAVTSALAQEIDGLEVVVHDDASTDATRDVLEAVRDPRVRYTRHPTSLGVARNRETCLAAARGRYVAWLDADDAYLPGALARQVAVLDELPAVRLVHGGFQVVDEDGRRLPNWPAPFARDSVETSAVAFTHLLAANEVTTSTVVVRRDGRGLAATFGGARRASSSDWAMWLRLALRGDVAYTTEPVARYRQHATGARLRCDLAVVRELLARERSRLPDKHRAATTAFTALAAKALAHAGDLLTRGDREASMRAVALAARLAPRPLATLAPALLRSTARGDVFDCYRRSKAMLGRLADLLEGTRYGAKLRAAATRDAAWEAVLARAAEAVRRVVPVDACVGSVTKWDPTLLALSGRRGHNFPDRRRLPDGYPRDGGAAVAHLEEMRRDGLSHLVFPSASFWWLEHYPALATHLKAAALRLWRDEDCVIYELGVVP